jgi:hypothetical protein
MIELRCCGYGCWSEFIKDETAPAREERAEAASGLVPGAARHNPDVGPQFADPH